MMLEDRSPRNSPIIFLTVVLSTTCVVLILMGWTMWDSYEASKISKERYSKIEELRGIIIHLDEVLTMSARMAAATGDLRWEKRYHSFEPKLDAAIKEAMGIAPEAHGSEAAAQTDAANIKLVTMENQAFDLVRQGRVDEASRILFGDAYERQKLIYSQGMTQFSASLSKIISAGMKRELHHALLYISAAILLIPLLLISLFLLFRAVRKWHVSLTSSNRILSEQSKELVALNKSLDEKVNERTAELTEANKMLQESEEKFRVLFEKNVHGILIVDIETRRFPYANPAFCRMFGYSETEMLQIGVEDIHPKDSLDYILSEFSRQKKGGKAGATELPCIHKDGTVFNADIAATNIVINHRKCVVGFFIDITERMQTEEALQKSEKQYRTLFEEINDAIFIVEKDTGRYLDANKAAAELTGRTLEELKQLTVHDITPEGADQRLLTIAEADGTKELGAVTYSKPDNTHRIAMLSSVPLGDNAVIGIARDITYELEVERQLRQSQKMESIGTLAGGIAHDFNNILFPIVGHTEMLLEDMPEDSPFRDSLNNIYTSALRAKDLVKQILTFSRQDKNKLMLMKMQPIIREALKLIRATIPSTIEIKQKIDSDCGVIKADPTQIHQIVMNLSTNAYHAMEKTGGVLKVILKEIQLGEYDIITPDMIPGVYVCLTVSDTGKGMNKELTQKVFDPFFTTKGIGKGTGMGLSVVHGIVNSMGGTIHVYSEPGKGTKFNVYFPGENKFLKEQTNQDKQPIQGGTEHILLVDDEESIILMETRMLKRLGYLVTSRTNSLEALEAFRAKPDKFDLVITDMAMPNMPGDKLSTELIKIRPDIPILLCTGFSETMSEEKATSVGIKGFLLKPIIMTDLAQNIREVLAGNKN
jgi:PAS domain S-box-containing protein